MTRMPHSKPPRRGHFALAEVGPGKFDVVLKSKYHRRQLGGGNALKAVTRARRSAPSRLICHVENVRPAVWRAHIRRAMAQREAAIAAEFAIDSALADVEQKIGEAA